ncbi:MAG: hypothetical protein ABI790_15755 [Betaproteobacteria bacterium]
MSKPFSFLPLTAVMLIVVALSFSQATSADTRTQQLEDLEIARREYVMASLAFSPEGRRNALAVIDQAKAQAGTLSNEAFMIAALRITAFAGNAHDCFNTSADSWFPATRLPLRMIWFADAMVIARAAPEHAELVGARVTAIDGKTPAQLLPRLRPLWGGTDDYLRWNAMWFIEFGGMLHALAVARSPAALTLDLELTDGRRVRRRMPFVASTSVPDGIGAVRLWSAELSPVEREQGWRAATDARAEPLALQQGGDYFRMAPLPEFDAQYVQFRANSTADAHGMEIAPFVQRVREALRAAPPRNLVLDLRFDIGGDIGQTRDLIRDLAGMTPGHIHVLIGPYTFSAGIVSAAAMKHDGGARVTVVGEDVGDRLRFWSEGENACLPNSRYCLRVTNGLWDLTRGCAQHAGCYGDAFDARVDSLAPLRAAFTADAWLKHRDPAMEVVRQHYASINK